MRRWFSSALWLSAWSSWAWLGFGLYRELPRDLGTVVCRLRLGPFEWARSFVLGSKYIAVAPLANPSSMKGKLFDARTGDVVREFDSPFMLSDQQLSRGVEIAVARKFKCRPLTVTDLVSGHQKLLSNQIDGPFQLHPTKPWLVFVESATASDPKRITVIDWTTGAKVFVRESQAGQEIDPPFFLGDADRLLVPIWRSAEHESDGDADVEVWRLGTTSRLEKTVFIPRLRASSRDVSRSGRIAWPMENAKEGDVSVFDIGSEGVVYSTPESAKSDDTEERRFLHGVNLSREGHGVMAGRPERLWSVDTSKLLWAPKNDETLESCDDMTFTVTEHRSFPSFGSFDQQNWNTVAVRDLETGTLLFRCWERDSSVWSCRSRDGSLGVTSGGFVYQLPYRVNYPLLALCQAILALPLVLTWLALRWRRMRRLRMAGTTL